jgi:hypothetical protein
MFWKTKTADIPVLEHEVLKVLYTVTMGLSKFGMTADSSVPIHKRDYKTGRLDYSVLTDMLNSPEKYTPAAMRAAREEDIYFFQDLILTTEDIIIKKYSYQQISRAIENLEADGNITEDEIKNVLAMRCRPINLTKKGELAFLNEAYTRKFAKESLDEQVGKAALLTGKRMKLFARSTAIVAIAAVFILMLELYQVYREANKPVPKSIPVYVYKDIPKPDTTAREYIPALRASVDSMKAVMNSILWQNRKLHHSTYLAQKSTGN